MQTINVGDLVKVNLREIPRFRGLVGVVLEIASFPIGEYGEFMITIITPDGRKTVWDNECLDVVSQSKISY